MDNNQDYPRTLQYTVEYFPMNGTSVLYKSAPIDVNDHTDFMLLTTKIDQATQEALNLQVNDQYGNIIFLPRYILDQSVITLRDITQEK